MSGTTRDLLEIFEKLPEAQQAEVADFARFLLARNDDAAWERTLADGKKRPKLEGFLPVSRAEGSECLHSAKM